MNETLVFAQVMTVIVISTAAILAISGGSRQRAAPGQLSC